MNITEQIPETCGFCGLPITLYRLDTGGLFMGMQGMLHHVINHQVMPFDWYGYPAAERIWAQWSA